MRSCAVRLVMCVFAVVTSTAAAQQGQPAASKPDVYHVHFTKAVPGQADALGKALMVPDATAPMPDHFVVLRHQEGDDWDYCVIQHLGPKATVDPAPVASNAARDMRAWHDDTFASGPSWAEFSRAMGIGGPATSAGMVYVVGVHRTVPGHREQLEKALAQPRSPSSKIQTGDVILQHLEGGDWQFMAITRYNSWQDFATDRTEAAGAASAPGGWADIRQHSAFHRDTIADRIAPK